MTDQEADEYLRNNDWCKWSDARWLLKQVANDAAVKARNEERQRIVDWLRVQRNETPATGQELATGLLFELKG